MSDFKKGDRVRVTIEGTASSLFNKGYAAGEHFGFLDDEGKVSGPWIFPSWPGVTVEKIEPPVEPFRAGDFVREVPTDRIFYVAENGYAQVKPTAGQFWKFGEAGVDGSLPSTTGEYERVEYAEVPF